MNDMVALLRPHNLAAKVGVNWFQNAGDFRTLAGSGPVSLAPHATGAIIDVPTYERMLEAIDAETARAGTAHASAPAPSW